MVRWVEKTKNYFMEQPYPAAVFHISSNSVSGMAFAAKERKFQSYFISPLRPGTVEPAFDKKNIKEPAHLEAIIQEGLKRLNVSVENIACLLPELCLKVFVLSFDSLPPSEKERDELVRWRVKKQMPVLTDDTRLIYEVFGAQPLLRVLVAAARMPVIQEYEDFFAKLRLRVRALGVATLNLLNVIDRAKDPDTIVVNADEDFVSLVAVIQSAISLYRLKPFSLDRQAKIPLLPKIDQIIQEIENTLHFVEDREKKKIGSIWLRCGMPEAENLLFEQLESRLTLPLHKIEPDVPTFLNPAERQWLSPLIGQIL